MPDIFDSAKRSEIMSKIRSKDTKAEVIVFRYLRQQNIYFQKHYKRGIGNPDIALPRKKKGVFIDGDFWHGRNLDALMARLPEAYWKEKIKKNVMRDAKYHSELKAAGWKVLRVWESGLIRRSTQKSELEKIAKFLLEL